MNQSIKLIFDETRLYVLNPSNCIFQVLYMVLLRVGRIHLRCGVSAISAARSSNTHIYARACSRGSTRDQRHTKAVFILLSKAITPECHSNNLHIFQECSWRKWSAWCTLAYSFWICSWPSVLRVRSFLWFTLPWCWESWASYWSSRGNLKIGKF